MAKETIDLIILGRFANEDNSKYLAFLNEPKENFIFVNIPSNMRDGRIFYSGETITLNKESFSFSKENGNLNIIKPLNMNHESDIKNVGAEKSFIKIFNEVNNNLDNVKVEAINEVIDKLETIIPKISEEKRGKYESKISELRDIIEAMSLFKEIKNDVNKINKVKKIETIKSIIESVVFKLREIKEDLPDLFSNNKSEIKMGDKKINDIIKSYAENCLKTGNKINIPLLQELGYLEGLNERKIDKADSDIIKAMAKSDYEEFEEYKEKVWEEFEEDIQEFIMETMEDVKTDLITETAEILENNKNTQGLEHLRNKD